MYRYVNIYVSCSLCHELPLNLSNILIKNKKYFTKPLIEMTRWRKYLFSIIKIDI